MPSAKATTTFATFDRTLPSRTEEVPSSPTTPSSLATQTQSSRYGTTAHDTPSSPSYRDDSFSLSLLRLRELFSTLQECQLQVQSVSSSPLSKDYQWNTSLLHDALPLSGSLPSRPPTAISFFPLVLSRYVVIRPYSLSPPRTYSIYSGRSPGMQSPGLDCLWNPARSDE